MAKNTKKNDALAMFDNIAKTKISKESPKMPVKEEIAIEIPKSKTEEIKLDLANKNNKSLIIQPPKRGEKNFKNRSFYIDDALYEKLYNSAKERGYSVSEYLSYILKQVL